jgi:hypothetical protein
VLHAQYHPENVGLERCGKAFRGLVRDRTNLAFSGGIVHRNVEAAEPCDGLIDHGADVILLANVCIDELGFRTEGAQLLNECLAGLITPTGNDDLRALLGEGDGGGAPDACEGSCDQNDLLIHWDTPGRGVASKTFDNKGLCTGIWIRMALFQKTL